MRKLFIIVVVIATLGFVGCNQPNQESTTNADSTASDTMAVDMQDTIYYDTVIMVK